MSATCFFQQCTLPAQYVALLLLALSKVRNNRFCWLLPYYETMRFRACYLRPAAMHNEVLISLHSESDNVFTDVVAFTNILKSVVSETLVDYASILLNHVKRQFGSMLGVLTSFPVCTQPKASRPTLRKTREGERTHIEGFK